MVSIHSMRIEVADFVGNDLACCARRKDMLSPS
jgi:hypothetical protein